MKTNDDAYCLHCTVAEVPPDAFWCGDCVGVFRAEVAAREEMRDEVVAYLAAHDRDLGGVQAILDHALDATYDDTPPTAYASLGDALAAQLHSAHPSGEDDPHAHASEAGMCARAVWYRVQGARVTDPPPLSAQVAMAIGSVLHPKIASAVAARYARVLLKYEHYWEQGNLSGHADLHYLDRDTRDVVCEIKTMNTFAFAHVKAPKWQHVLQGAVNAQALGASLVQVVYVNTGAKRADSPLREFVVPVDEGAATREANRLEAIADAPLLPGRFGFDDDGQHLTLTPEASNPNWNCAYCAYRRRCIQDGE